MPQSKSPSSDPPSGWRDPEAGGLRVTSLLTLFGTILIVLATEVLGGNRPANDLDHPSFRSFRDGSLAREIENDFAEHSVVADLVRPPYNEFAFLLLDRYTDRVVVGRDHWLFESSNVRNYPRPGAEKLLERHYEAISAMVAWFESRGTRVLALPLPNKWALYPDKLPDLKVPPRSVWPDLVRGLKARGVWTLDAAPALAPGPLPTFFPNDSHWSDQGALATASLMAEEIERSFGAPLPGPVFAGSIALQEGRSWEGDLQRMLGFRKGSALERSFTAARSRVRVVDARGHDLAEPEGERPIVLCGTSFSHTLDFAAKLGALLGREIEDRSLPGKGPTVELLALARAMIAGERQAPALLVWEFPEKHVFVRQKEFLEPLEAFIVERANEDRYPESSRREIGVAGWSATNATVTQDEDGAFIGQPTSGDPMLIIDLAEELPANEGWALCYRVITDTPTTSKILWDWGGGFQRDEKLVQQIGGRGRPQLICIPVSGPDGRRSKRLRLDPVDSSGRFELRDIHLRKR